MRRLAVIACLIAGMAVAQGLRLPYQPAVCIGPGSLSASDALDLANGLHLSVSGGAAYASNAYTFDGSNDMLFKLTNDFGKGWTRGFAMGATVRLNAATSTTFRVWATGRNTSDEGSGGVQIVNGNLQWNTRTSSAPNDNAAITTTGNSMVSGVWYRVFVSADGTNAQLYINGVSLATVTNLSGSAPCGRTMASLTGMTHVAIGNLKRSTDVFSPGKIAAPLIFYPEWQPASAAWQDFGENFQRMNLP